MKHLFLILFPLQVFGQVWTKDIKPTDYNVNLQGSWVHMDRPNQKGSYAKSQGAYLEYEATMFQIEVYTEKSINHSYYIIDIDGQIDTVKVKGDTLNISTFQRWWKEQKKRTVKIYGLPYQYVINYFKVFVDSDPLHRPIYEDSIACKTDTLIIEKPVYIVDTVFIPADTIRMPQDTLLLQPKIFIIADSLKFEIE